MMKYFYAAASGFFLNKSLSNKKGSRNSLMCLEIMDIIWYGFCNDQIFPQLNTCGIFLADKTLNERIFIGGMVFHPSSGVPESNRFKAKVHWNC